MLRNFDTPLDDARVTRMVVVPQERPVQIEQRVTILTPRSDSRAYLAKPDEAWEWSDLRDYVVTQIEARFGVFPRDVRKESGIFKSYLARYPQGPRIARYAFETAEGFWMGAPISVTRFCKGSDPYFSDVIAERLAQLPARS